MFKILHGDCLAVLPTLPSDSVDAVVTDPPYGLEFMGKEWDGADGFRRSLNEADIGRDNAFGRMSARAPEYRTAGTGQKNKPGIGERETEWVSNQGWNQFRCEACGHLFHGGSPCQCAEPKPIRADNRWNLFQAWCEAWARECLRVLKPGGHIAAFGGTRTYHRLACAVEDAGFEIRDQIQWLYGSGFPKSRNIGEGRGTALKPAHEPIVLARKPLIGTVAANVEKHKTGALNIDTCRVGDFVNETPPGTDRYNQANFEQGYRPSAYPTNGREGEPSAERRYTDKGGTNFAMKPGQRRKGGRRPSTQEGYQRPGATMFQDKTDWELSPQGRWPANVIHDGSEEVLDGFPDRDGAASNGKRLGNGYGEGFGAMEQTAGYADSGSAARFFYTAKADKGDRLSSKHPTVKPVDLMAYLCRLITPPGGVVLDLFAGSGTTGMACLREGFDCILIERESEYVADIERRVAHVSGTDSPLFAGVK